MSDLSLLARRLCDALRRHPYQNDTHCADGGTRWVHPNTHQIAKFLPNNPPMRGEHLLVDGVRCLVLCVKVSWEGRDWTLHGVKVRPDA